MMVPDGENKENALLEYLTESKEELRGRMRPYEWRPKQLRRMEEKAAQLSRMAFDVYSCDEEGKNLNPVMITAARKLMDEIKEEGRRLRLWGYPLRSKENIIKDRNFIRDEAFKDFQVIYGEREKFSEAMSWKIGREVFYKGLGKAA